MKSGSVGTIFGMIVIVAGCSLRKDLPTAMPVGLSDASGSEVVLSSDRDANASSGAATEGHIGSSGSDGPSANGGSTVVGPGGIAITGSGGSTGSGGPATGGATTGSTSTGNSGAQTGVPDAAVDGPLLMRGLGEDGICQWV